MKININTLSKMKKDATPVAWVTAYDLPFAYAAEQAGIDMILVGDSGGMVQLGYQTTNPVTMDEMIMLAKSARRGAPNTFMVGDMPQGSYEVSKEKSVENSLRFIKEAGMDCIKLEGGKRVTDKVEAIVSAGISVMGHLGLTPQSASTFGGYTVQGKTLESFNSIMEDAFELQSAGVFSILLEAMPEEPANQIANQLSIPVYGIGAGNRIDGQLVIIHDLMGFYQAFRPWFAKCYVPEVIQKFQDHLQETADLKKTGRETRTDGLLVLAEMAIKQYILDVKEHKFPNGDYTYSIKKDDLESLKQSNHWKS